MNFSSQQIAILYNEDGQITRGDPQDLLAVQCTITAANHLHEALSSLGYPVIKIAVRGDLDELEDTLSAFSPSNTFIFNNCDGFAGENIGAVQVIRVLERMGFKHTGSSAETVALCTDKPRAKEHLRHAGIPTPNFQVFDKPMGDFMLEFPVIVKPSIEDASMGIDLSSVVTNTQDMFNRVAYILEEYEQPAMVEQFVSGRELAVGMWGNQRLEFLPIAEDDFSAIPDPLQHVLTYDSKWKPDSFLFQNVPSRIPASLNRKEEQAIRKVAGDTFRAMGLRDIGRVDIRFDNGIPYIIDINELPDLSPDAGFWNQAKTAGYQYPQMVEKILTHAMKREGWAV